jgi:hypothetical protein
MSLQYDESYHLHCRLALASGREIILEGLYQQMTYAGLVEGVPNSEANDWIVDRVMKKAAALCVQGARPHIISPPRRDYLRTPGDNGHSSEWRPEWLPCVACIGEFKAAGAARGTETGMLSTLTVVWFQDDFALPILEPALSALVALDWSSLATDFEW